MAAQKTKKKSSRMNRREWIAGYLFLLPNFIGFLAFTGIPVIIGFIISLTDYTGFGKPNFAKMFTDTDFKVALQNNLFYSLTSVPLTVLFALLLALMLNRKMYGGSAFQTVFSDKAAKERLISGLLYSIVKKPSAL